jgi:hypothetical protein
MFLDGYIVGDLFTIGNIWGDLVALFLAALSSNKTKSALDA